MPQYREIAESVFGHIASSRPGLAARHSRTDEADPELVFPLQPGLAFEIELYLADDILNLCVDSFWGEWFPCTDTSVRAAYIDAVLGLLSGHLRIVERFRNGRYVLGFLQEPSGDGWRSLHRHHGGFALPWLPTTERVLRNAAV